MPRMQLTCIRLVTSKLLLGSLQPEHVHVCVCVCIRGYPAMILTKKIRCWADLELGPVNIVQSVGTDISHSVLKQT